MNIYPSLLGVPNLLTLQEVIDLLNPHCDGFHIDIMDNHFVPNLTWGAPLTNAIDQAAITPSWVHLMVDNPLSIIKQLSIKEESIISFHIETISDPMPLYEIFHSNGWKSSIALKPLTPIEHIFPYLSKISHVLLMSVEPGFSGQQFLEDTLPRLQALATFKRNNNLSFHIGVDGGINTHNIKQLTQYGVSAVAIASDIFKTPNYVNAVKKLYAISNI